MQVVEYRGWKNNLRLANADAELVVTLDVGPRVISYRQPGGVNVLKNYDSMMGGTGEAEWQIRGGHRFWLAPEDLTRTYFPDNRPVKWEKIGDLAVRFTPPPETEYGVQKVMELQLAQQGTRVDVKLRVTNTGKSPTDLAPWGPTVTRSSSRSGDAQPQPESVAPVAGDGGARRGAPLAERTV